MTDKASHAFKTISEVSNELDVPPHVLRFWETKFSSLRPLKRSGGRRYYRPDDVKLITKIRNLLYKDGFTIKGAQRFLKLKETDSSLNGKPITTQVDGMMELIEAKALLMAARQRLIALKQQLNV